MALARLWLDGAGRSASRHRRARAGAARLVLDEGVAEAQVAFDAYPGGVRNHDVLACGHVDAGGVVVGIEGKVNESLDTTITRKYRDAARPLTPGKAPISPSASMPYCWRSPAARSRTTQLSAAALPAVLGGRRHAGRGPRGHRRGRGRRSPRPHAPGQGGEVRGSARGGGRLRAGAEPRRRRPGHRAADAAPRARTALASRIRSPAGSRWSRRPRWPAR